jgi:hypothetical protein
MTPNSLSPVVMVVPGAISGDGSGAPVSVLGDDGGDGEDVEACCVAVPSTDPPSPQAVVASAATARNATAARRTRRREASFVVTRAPGVVGRRVG